MTTADENLKKHLELAIRQLEEIKQQKKKFDQEELFRLEIEITNRITELIEGTEEAWTLRRSEQPWRNSESDVEDYADCTA